MTQGPGRGPRGPQARVRRPGKPARAGGTVSSDISRSSRDDEEIGPGPPVTEITSESVSDYCIPSPRPTAGTAQTMARQIGCEIFPVSAGKRAAHYC